MENHTQPCPNCGRVHDNDYDPTGNFMAETIPGKFISRINPRAVAPENWSMETHSKLVTPEVKSLVRLERDNVLIRVTEGPEALVHNMEMALTLMYLAGYHVGQAEMLGKDG